jgi:membrane protease subunit HflK
MHYRLPWPVDRVDVVKTTSVMKIGVGFVLPSGDGELPAGMEVLTGDTNILNVAMVLQYVIRDPAEFLFQINDAAAFVEAAAEAALTETIAAMPVDEVLTRGRVAVQERVKTQVQEILDRRHGGISIVSASIMTMMLDRSVAQAFQDVAGAMADREKMINEARAYQNNLIPKARGDARTLRSEASPKPSAERTVSYRSKRNTRRGATSPGPGSISRPWRRSCRGCVSTSSIPIRGACRCILE